MFTWSKVPQTGDGLPMLGPWQSEHYGKANNHASKGGGRRPIRHQFDFAQDTNKGALHGVAWDHAMPMPPPAPPAAAPPPAGPGPPAPPLTPTRNRTLPYNQHLHMHPRHTLIW